MGGSTDYRVIYLFVKIRLFALKNTFFKESVVGGEERVKGEPVVTLDIASTFRHFKGVWQQIENPRELMDNRVPSGPSL